MDIIGDIRDAKVPKKPTLNWNQNVLSYETPFGRLLVSRDYHNRINWYLGPITIRFCKGEIYSAGKLWLNALDKELFLSLVPKLPKPRKSRAICPGLDLRPIQQEYRKRLGDLHRLKANKNLFHGLWPYVTIEINMELAERKIKEEYELAKAQAIVNFIKAQKEKENE